MTTNPTFDYLLNQYMALHEQGLSKTEEASQLFGEMMFYAPEEFQALAREKAIEMGLMPAKPDGYSPTGEPLYNLDAMCERLDIDPEEIPDFIMEHAYQGEVHSVN